MYGVCCTEATALRPSIPGPSRSNGSLRPPSGLSLPPGRRLRRRASFSKHATASMEVGRVTERRALTVFGHLFACACIRLDYELAVRGAWQHEGKDPPLQSPRHVLSHLPNHRRLQQVSLQASRGLSRALQQHRHGGRETVPASEKAVASNGEDSRPLHASGESLLTPQEGKVGAHGLSTRSLLAPDDTISSPTSGMGSGGTSPTSSGGQSYPQPHQGLPGPASIPGELQQQRPCAEEPPDNLLHRRAQLCFGEALKEVRNAVDAVLCDGAVETVSDLQAICRGCWS